MSLYDFLHRIFNSDHGGNVRPPEKDENYSFKTPREPFWNFKDEENVRDFSSVFDFKTMTDPFEMHRFFEQRMSEIMSTFFSSQSFPGIQESDIYDFNNLPAIEEKKSPRDHYLKPGLSKTQPNEGVDKSQNGMLGHITPWLESMVPPTMPGQPDGSSQPREFSSFTSRVRKTVTLPDGTVKTEEIFRNSDGTEERTESHIFPKGTTTQDIDSSLISPDILNLMEVPPVPDVKIDSPKDYFLKPGYEKLKPNEEKIDKDLDKQILRSGFGSLPSFTKESVEPKPNFSFKSFSRKTVTLPNGVIESEEVVRNADGTEQRTVTQTLPDGTSTVVPNPQSGLLIEGLKKNELELKQSVTIMGVKDLLGIFFK